MMRTPAMYRLTIVPVLFLTLSTQCAALSASANSPWASSEWKFTVDFGRESSTELSKEWGASGARLVLPVPVSVDSETIPSRHIDPVVGSGAMGIEPMECATYINSRGKQTVDIDGGGWKIEMPQGGKGLASSLRICLDLRTKLERNDVLVSPDRLYLFAPCWREEEYRRGKKALAPIAAAAEDAQRVLDEQLSHESGDRRLDGTDPIDTALAYKDMALLVAERDEWKKKRREAEKIYPRERDDTSLGFWPGTTEPLVIGRGTMLIKKKKLFGDELHVIGRWNAAPVVSEVPEMNIQ